MGAKHDFIQIHSEFVGTMNIQLDKIGLTWPPPEFLIMDGGEIREATDKDDRKLLLHRQRMSQLTEEQMKKLTGIARGAEYKYVFNEEVNNGK